jgi:hypothetical protein
LIEIGEEFCGSKSEDLQNSIKKQSSNYFRNYHHDRLEELRIFLENESWEMCPVKPDFTILQLQVCIHFCAHNMVTLPVTGRSFKGGITLRLRN